MSSPRPSPFQVLHRVLEDIHFIYDETQLANALLAAVSRGLEAQAGSIFRLKDGGGIELLAAYGAPFDKLKKTELRVGQDVVGWVARMGEAVRIDDAAADPRFTGGVDRITGFRTRSIVSAPILSKGKVVGVIEFLNGPFGDADLELIAMIGREVGIAFENVALIRKLERSRAFLTSVLESLHAGIIVADREGDVVEMNPRAQAILHAVWEAREPARSALEVLSGCPEMLEVLRKATELEAPLSRAEREMTLGGKTRRIGYSAVPIRAKDHARLGTTVLFQDLTDLKG